MKDIKGITVALRSPMRNHIANGGEQLLGNASSIKRRPDDRVYISGQMQRHALFRAIERLNLEDENRGDTYVSNGDGTTYYIEKDLRADLGGFMHPSLGNYSSRRTAPVSATFAVAMEESAVGRDLLLRLKQDPDEGADQDQALVTNEFSQADDMEMSFHLDVSALSISKRFEYGDDQNDDDQNDSWHVDTVRVKHVPEEERIRRAMLFLEATRFLTDYANQARNATTGEPQKAFIVLDTRLSRKASRYFDMTDAEKKNLKKELHDRGAEWWFGDDTTTNDDTVLEAYKAAEAEMGSLFDPSDEGPMPFESFKEVADE